MHDPFMYPSGKANQDTAAGQTRLGSHIRYHRTVPSPCHHRCHGNATGERWRGGTVQMGGLNRHPLKRMARAQPRFDLGGLGSGGTGCANIYIHIYERERERERERGGGPRPRPRPRRRRRGEAEGDEEETASAKTKTIATKRPKKSINGSSDPALPDHAPDQNLPRTSPPRSPTPTPVAAAPSPGQRPAIRRGAVGRGEGVAPGRHGSEAGCRSGSGPAPTAAPFLIAAVFPPKGRGFRCGDHRHPRVGAGGAGGRFEAFRGGPGVAIERSPRRRRRRPLAVASHLN